MSPAESSRGGSLSAMRPARRSAFGGPAATAMTRCPCSARSSTRRRASAGTSATLAITSNAPLMMRSSFPSRSTAKASEVLVAGSKGTKRTSRSVVRARLRLGRSRSNGGVDRVLIRLGARQRRKRQHALAIEPRHRDDIDDLQRIARQRPGLVGAQDVHGGGLVRGREAGQQNAAPGEDLGAECGRQRERRRQRHRDRGQQRRQGEADQVGETATP